MTKDTRNQYHRQRAQSTLEYAMVIACLAAALFGMQIYIKRSIQGKLRDAANEIGEQYSAKTTTSSLTQIITNPADVTVTAKPRFIEVTDPKTGFTEKREIVEVTRHEPITVSIGEGSYEETGKLSEEGLFEGK